LLERSGKDLRNVDLLVGSGGVLRHNDPADALAVLSSATGGDGDEGWLVPRMPRIVIDKDYVLAPAGLLAEHNAEAAHRLLSTLLT
jgi:hypothetical protein